VTLRRLPTDEERDEVLAEARRILAQAPRHDGHRHGLVIGQAGDQDGRPVPIVVVAVQGLAEPVWVSLDADDVAVIARMAHLTAGPVQ
jgi:hypothetical protein